MGAFSTWFHLKTTRKTKQKQTFPFPPRFHVTTFFCIYWTRRVSSLFPLHPQVVLISEISVSSSFFFFFSTNVCTCDEGNHGGGSGWGGGGVLGVLGDKSHNPVHPTGRVLKWFVWFRETFLPRWSWIERTAFSGLWDNAGLVIALSKYCGGPKPQTFCDISSTMLASNPVVLTVCCPVNSEHRGGLPGFAWMCVCVCG